MQMQRRIRLIVVDDHSKVHFTIASLIKLLDDVELIAQGSTGQEAIALCREYQPDIVLMDIVMPELDGIAATRQIVAEFPAIKILALSGFQDQSSVRAMIEAGAVGYVLKTSSMQDLANTIRAVYAGKAIFSMEVTTLLFAQPQPVTTPTTDYGLTPREREVLQLLVDGLNNTQIAETLTISMSTAKHHVSNILTKMQVESRVEAVAIAIRNNLAN